MFKPNKLKSTRQKSHTHPTKAHITRPTSLRHLSTTTTRTPLDHHHHGNDHSLHNNKSKRGFSGYKQAPGGKKLSQAELIIQQHREKQKAIELEKIRAAQAAQAAGTQAPPAPKGSRSAPPPPQQKPKPNTQQQQQTSQDPNKPSQQPGKNFIREQKMGKTHKLPPGMTIEDLNKMPPEMIAKTLNIDMGMIEALNDEREDDFDVQFSEDSSADATPPLPYRPDPGEDGVKYTAARIQGRHTVNMMPSVAPRPADFKGRVTIIRKLPPTFEQVHRNLRKVVMTLMKIQKLSHFDLAVTLVAAQGMQFINRQHRFVDSPTDVLAFTMEEPYCEGIPVELGNIADLGEIIISVPYIYAQSAIRHAMLRSLGYDLSDSRRPLTDMEKVRKIFQDVGQVEIAEDGSLKVHTLKHGSDDDLTNKVIDINDGKPTTKFGTEAEKLAGSLPPITLTSAQLDTLPPFDKDYIHAQVQDMLSGDQRQEQHAANINRKAQKAMEMLETMRDNNVHLIGNDDTNTHTHSSPSVNNNTNNTNNTNNNNNNTKTNDLIHSHNNKLQPHEKAQKWHLSQGFPPQNYFSYITESMVVDEMNIVLIHGFLHLCGYDHDTAHRRDLMQAETDRVVGLLLKEGVISQRCADLSALYVLDDAPEFVSEDSEDELLPVGLFADKDTKPMTDGEIAKKLREFEERGFDNDNTHTNNTNNNTKQQQQHQQGKKSTAAFTSNTAPRTPTDANFAQKNNTNRQSTQTNNTQQYNDTVASSGPVVGQFRTAETNNNNTNSTQDRTVGSQFHSTNKLTPMTATSTRDIFKQKKPSGKM